MRTRARFALPSILGTLVLSGAPLLAGSGSAPLQVSVTVVRSCAVGATSIDRGTAQLDLNCASGAASGVRRFDQQPQESVTRLRLQLPTSPSTRGSDSSLEVVTVNF